MDKKRMISDVARELDVETHVLRYWEEELQLPIPRNEMGHRYYGDQEIKLLQEIKKQKKKGMSLKEMREKLVPVSNDQDQNQKLEQFQAIMVKVIGQALQYHKDEFGKKVGDQVANRVAKEVDYQFRQREELEELRYKKIDELIRDHQRTNAEAAYTKESKRKRGFFRKKER